MSDDLWKGILIGAGIVLGAEALALLIARQNWPAVRGYFADSIDRQAMAQLSTGDSLLWVPAVSSTLLLTTGKGLQQTIHDNLSLTVADGIGDALLIRPSP